MPSFWLWCPIHHDKALGIDQPWLEQWEASQLERSQLSGTWSSAELRANQCAGTRLHPLPGTTRGIHTHDFSPSAGLEERAYRICHALKASVGDRGFPTETTAWPGSRQREQL